MLSPQRFPPKNLGLTFIETLVGIALMLMVFLGIFGLIQLSLKVVAQSKVRITATALANQKIELARNLPYDKVGTVGGVPAGSIPETETVQRNRMNYTVKTTITYVDDPFDNTFPNDPLPWDYKKIKVAVSWSELFAGQVSLMSNVTPKGIETTGGGGIISILVFDANGQPVPQVSAHVENSIVAPPIDANYQTDNQGRLFLPGAPACNDCYKITASKADYSSERTYAVGEIVRGVVLATPDKPYLSVIEGQLSEISFTIDRLATKTVQTIRYAEEKTWGDSFDDESKISEKFQVVASSTLLAMILEEQAPNQYFSSGYFLSATITPVSLVEWGRLNWSDETPISTEIKYQLLYFTAGNWVLIPDADLTVGGVTNSQGFFDPPVDLSGIDPLKYPSVTLKANFSTTDPAQTPILFDWQITWFSSDTTTPVPNLAFTVTGAKSLGTDGSGQPVYKYQENLSTDSNGQLTIPNLEWDSYKITVSGTTTGYDLANSSPAQPINLDPNTPKTVVLKLADHQSHTLLAAVKDPAGQALAGANVRLFKTGYDKTKLSSESGQTFFSPLSQTAYTLEVKMSGYQDWSEQINIAGQSEQTVTMTTP